MCSFRVISASLLIALLAGVAASCRSTDKPSAATGRRASPEAQPTPTLERTARAEEATSQNIGRVITLPPLTAVSRSRFNQADALRDSKAAVFVMTSVGCPVSNMYAPRIAALEIEYAGRAVRFFFINTVGAETADEMREQVIQYGFRGPYLPDQDGSAAEALDARTTTEVFVLDPAGTLRYRGAVDDQYGVGAALDAPRKRYLREAIDAVLAGKAPEIAVTSAPGCLVDRKSRFAAAPDPASLGANVPTYHGKISRILESSCVECHHTGGPAPFTLAGPNSLLGRASMIEAVIRDGLMPPSHGLNAQAIESKTWASPIQLSKSDRDDLLTWLAANRPLGDPAEAIAHMPRRLGWAIGSPDTLMVTPSLRVPAEGPLVYGRMALASRVQTDQVLTAMEFKAVKPGSIHHALVWLVPPGVPIPDPGFVPNSDGPIQLLGTFSPANGVVRYPGGVARRIPVGSVLLADVYARPMGKQMMVSLRIAGKFAELSPTLPARTPDFSNEVRSLILRAPSLDIPAGEADIRHSAECVLSSPARLLSVTPSMRARGRAISLEARLPDGSVQSLFEASNYDFRWLMRYQFAEPRDLPKGTRLILRGVHDNSPANHANPNPEAPTRDGVAMSQEALLVAIEWISPPTGSRSPEP